MALDTVSHIGDINLMETWKSVKKELLKDPEAAKEYRRLEPTYSVISQLIKQRIDSGLTQAQLAKKIGTKQSAISRLESGEANPTLHLLEKIAAAVDKKLVVTIG